MSNVYKSTVVVEAAVVGTVNWSVVEASATVVIVQSVVECLKLILF